MFCKFCGYEIEKGATFCVNCGKSLEWTSSYENQGAVSQVREGFINKFASKNYLIAIILFTVATGLSFLASATTGNLSFPIIEIFAIIAFWKLRLIAGNNGELNEFVSPLKTLRVINVIQRVVLWVFAGIFGVTGIFMLVSGITFNEDFAASFIEGFNGSLEGFEFGGFEELIALFTDNVYVFLIILGAAFLVIAIISAVFAATMYTTFVKCAKQYEETADTGENIITKQKSARAWLIVAGVFAAIGTVTTGVSDLQTSLIFLSNGANAVSLFFFASILKEDNLW